MITQAGGDATNIWQKQLVRFGEKTPGKRTILISTVLVHRTDPI